MYPRFGKKTKYTSGLIRYLNAGKKKLTQTTSQQIHYQLQDKKDIPDWDLKDRSQLVGKTDYTKRDTTTNMPTKRTIWARLLAIEFSLLLRKGWFTGIQFSAGTPISKIKYNHLGLQHENNFYLFKDQLDYALAHYFAESETTKGNTNKFLYNLWIAPLTKKLSYKNVDEWMQKLLEIF